LWLPPPSSGDDLPVVALIHGGYWRAAFTKRLMNGLAEAMAVHGWAAWNIEYRRMGRFGGGGGWPATFADIRAAIDHVQQLPRVDPSRLVTCGHSAGGQLALWVASRNEAATGIAATSPVVQPRGAVALAGVVDLVRGAELRLGGDAVRQFLGGLPEEHPERYRSASPAALLPIGIPQVLVHGLADTAVLVLWTLEAALLGWAPSRVGFLAGAIAVAAVVWCLLQRAKQLTSLWCHVLAALGSVLVATLVYASQSTGSALAATLFLVPMATFVALYLGGRAILGHQIFAALGLWLALFGTLHAGGASVVAVAVSIAVLSASVTVRALVVSMSRRGSVDPDTGLPNGIGLAHRLSAHAAHASVQDEAVFVMATVQLAGHRGGSSCSPNERVSSAGSPSGSSRRHSKRKCAGAPSASAFRCRSTCPRRRSVGRTCRRGSRPS
jgi:hypothetical protein